MAPANATDGLLDVFDAGPATTMNTATAAANPPSSTPGCACRNDAIRRGEKLANGGSDSAMRDRAEAAASVSASSNWDAASSAVAAAASAAAAARISASTSRRAESAAPRQVEALASASIAMGRPNSSERSSATSGILDDPPIRRMAARSSALTPAESSASRSVCTVERIDGSMRVSNSARTSRTWV